METVDRALEQVRRATVDTAFEGRIHLVGGILRDRILGLPESGDVDLVCQADALAVARLLDSRGLSAHRPVLYPRFGTAMLTIGGCQIELVTARAESYAAGSRKPVVRPASLREDILRRDFTINTLTENLHTGESLDLTGLGRADIADGVIRTPLDPHATFYDDPLRMLRAIRFAARFGFRITDDTWQAILRDRERIRIVGVRRPVVSAERIRDEAVKTLLTSDPAGGMDMLRSSGLLEQFAPELAAMVGVAQNSWHKHDVWDHTMAALRACPPGSSVDLRLAVLFHDIGKPRAITEDERGIHFYDHQQIGAEMTVRVLQRLKLTNERIRDIAALVRLHMRLGEARPTWSDPAIRRLIRDTAEYRDALFDLARCDIAGMADDAPVPDIDALRERMDRVEAESHASRIVSPLDGTEIIRVLAVPPGPIVGRAKDYLVNEVIDGRLAPDDVDGARGALLAWHGRLAAGQPGANEEGR